MMQYTENLAKLTIGKGLYVLMKSCVYASLNFRQFLKPLLQFNPLLVFMTYPLINSLNEG